MSLSTETVTAQENPAATVGGFRQPDSENLPDLLVWDDTCNVYVLRDGETALLIDLGDGSVLPHLADIGIKRIEWLLLTHHHREQCQGIHRIDRSMTKVAVPKAEQLLFEKPMDYRKWFPTLGDAYSVYGASYVRPLQKSIPLDQVLEAGKPFLWHAYEIQCLDTPGHSPGSMSYVIRQQGKSMAFTGGVVHDGAGLWFRKRNRHAAEVRGPADRPATRLGVAFARAGDSKSPRATRNLSREADLVSAELCSRLLRVRFQGARARFDFKADSRAAH